MDGPTTIPSSLSVSSLQRDIARRISGNYWDSAEIQNSSQSSCGNTKTAQQLSLPAQHLANPRAPSSPQTATSADDGARQRQDSPQTATSAAMIFDVGKFLPARSKTQGGTFGCVAKFIGCWTNTQESCGEKMSRASGKNARNKTQGGRKRRWGFSEEKSLPIFGESDHKQMHFIGCCHSVHNRVC